MAPATDAQDVRRQRITGDASPASHEAGRHGISGDHGSVKNDTKSENSGIRDRCHGRDADGGERGRPERERARGSPSYGPGSRDRGRSGGGGSGGGGDSSSGTGGVARDGDDGHRGARNDQSRDSREARDRRRDHSRDHRRHDRDEPERAHRDDASGVAARGSSNGSRDERGGIGRRRDYGDESRVGRSERDGQDSGRVRHDSRGRRLGGNDSGDGAGRDYNRRRRDDSRERNRDYSLHGGRDSVNNEGSRQDQRRSTEDSRELSFRRDGTNDRGPNSTGRYPRRDDDPKDRRRYERYDNRRPEYGRGRRVDGDDRDAGVLRGKGAGDPYREQRDSRDRPPDRRESGGQDYHRGGRVGGIYGRDPPRFNNNHYRQREDPHRRDHNNGSGRGESTPANVVGGFQDGQWVGGDGASGNAYDVNDRHQSRAPICRSHGAERPAAGPAAAGHHQISNSSHDQVPGIAANRGTGTTTAAQLQAIGDVPRRPRWDKAGSGVKKVPEKQAPPAKKKLVWGGAGTGGGGVKRPLFSGGAGGASALNGIARVEDGSHDGDGQQAIGVEERWQEAATALGPADRQAKFLRLLGAKKGTTAAAVAAGASATGETDSAQPSASSSSSALRNEGGGQAANAKVMQDLEIHYQKAHRAHFGFQRGLGR